MNELKLRDDILDELAYEPIVDPAHIGVAVDQDVVRLPDMSAAMRRSWRHYPPCAA
jgi:hypothetical protein